MCLIGRCHPPIEAGPLPALLSALDTRPAIAALYKVTGRLALIILQLIARDVRGQPMNPYKSTCNRIRVFVFQNDRKRNGLLWRLLNFKWQGIRWNPVFIKLGSAPSIFPPMIPVLVTIIIPPPCGLFNTIIATWIPGVNYPLFRRYYSGTTPFSISSASFPCAFRYSIPICCMIFSACKSSRPCPSVKEYSTCNG